MLRVMLVRSPIGGTQRQRQTLRALGLTRLRKTVILRDTPPVRGRLRVVQHLVEVQS
jgi:large subunit ribosomal protein L30